MFFCALFLVSTFSCLLFKALKAEKLDAHPDLLPLLQSAADTGEDLSFGLNIDGEVEDSGIETAANSFISESFDTTIAIEVFKYALQCTAMRTKHRCIKP